ncbi:MAG TPA: hypothetical protein VK638_01565 [Edaphobacter sp.]|nr:hypothetical protein [Edaphobacter sp.]
MRSPHVDRYRIRGGLFADPAKLIQPVGAKLQFIADELKSEGWKCVAVQPEIDHTFVNRHRRVNAPLLSLSAEAQVDLEALAHERDALVERFDQTFSEGNGNEDNERALRDRIEEIEDRIRSLKAGRKRDYSDAMRSSAGVVVGISYNGQPEIIRGLLTKEDEVKLIRGAQNDEAVSSMPMVDDTKRRPSQWNLRNNRLSL